MSSSTQSGYAIITEPYQKKEGLYRVMKTTNITLSLNQMNLAKARKDCEIIGFYPCTDLAKVEAIMKPALKNKYLAGTTEWIVCEDESTLNKLKMKIETLVEIGNES